MTTSADTDKIENTVCKALAVALKEHHTDCLKDNDIRYIKAPHWMISYAAFAIIIGTAATAIGMYYGDKAFYLDKISQAETAMRSIIDSRYDSLQVEITENQREIIQAIRSRP